MIKSPGMFLNQLIKDAFTNMESNKIANRNKGKQVVGVEGVSPERGFSPTCVLK